MLWVHLFSLLIHDNNKKNDMQRHSLTFLTNRFASDIVSTLHLIKNKFFFISVSWVWLATRNMTKRTTFSSVLFLCHGAGSKDSTCTSRAEQQATWLETVLNNYWFNMTRMYKPLVPHIVLTWVRVASVPHILPRPWFSHRHEAITSTNATVMTATLLLYCSTCNLLGLKNSCHEIVFFSVYFLFIGSKNAINLA